MSKCRVCGKELIEEQWVQRDREACFLKLVQRCPDYYTDYMTGDTNGHAYFSQLVEMSCDRLAQIEMDME